MLQAEALEVQVFPTSMRGMGVTHEPADRAALTAGANVLINGTRAEDGKVTATTNVPVGKERSRPDDVIRLPETNDAPVGKKIV
jgi:hypothetical protein